MNSLFPSSNTSSVNRALNQSGQRSGITEQILFAAAIILVVYVTFVFVEIMYKYINKLSMSRVPLIKNTCNMDTRAINLTQNPNRKDAKLVNLSDNERTGIEFSYSFYIHVHPSAFRQEYGLLHIFHKGFSTQFPLLAPGVYMRSDTNTMRVYMNTYKTWNNYIEVENFPVNKWVHTVILCRDNALEVFINGNLAKRMSFEGYAPYQNYQDICCFSKRRITYTQSIVPSVDKLGFDVFDSLKGMMSRLIYFNYALSYAEIQHLMNEGPSSEMETSDNTDVPPYLTDTWWTQQR